MPAPPRAACAPLPCPCSRAPVSHAALIVPQLEAHHRPDWNVLLHRPLAGAGGRRARGALGWGAPSPPAPHFFVSGLLEAAIALRCCAGGTALRCRARGLLPPNLPCVHPSPSLPRPSPLSLPPLQVDKLTNEHSIYLTRNGRIRWVLGRGAGQATRGEGRTGMASRPQAAATPLLCSLAPILGYCPAAWRASTPRTWAGWPRPSTRSPPPEDQRPAEPTERSERRRRSVGPQSGVAGRGCTQRRRARFFAVCGACDLTADA